MYLILKALALPPANLVLLIAFGLLLRRWRRRAGLAVAVIGAAALYALATPFIATRLLAAIGSGVTPGDAAPAPDNPPGAPGAIVVLAAGFVDTAPRAGSPTVDAMTLERLRHGVRLHRRTGLPILVTGGPSPRMATPIGVLMQRTLRRDFAVEAAWVEGRAGSTFKNATHSAKILTEAGIRSIYVVSQAWHLPRAIAAFNAAGLATTPAASSYVRPAGIEPAAFLPSAKALQRSYYAAHEFLGLIWYRWSLFGPG